MAGSDEVMLDELENVKRSGKFRVSPDKDVYGELVLAGAKTNLLLREDHDFQIASHERCIRGVLHDDSKVSLLKCFVESETHGDPRNFYKKYDVFAHYVLQGQHHMPESEEAVLEINFVVDDAPTLFYDFDAFGSVIDARPYIDSIANANAEVTKRKVVTGPDPVILYFSGKSEIFSADTVFGKISAWHNPSHNIGGPRGVKLNNTIYISIAYSKAITFEDAIANVGTLHRYVSTLIGRPQNISKLNVRIPSEDSAPAYLNAYWSMPPVRDSSIEGAKPHVSEILIDAVMEPEVFSRVLTNWLAREKEWSEARWRFFGSFSEQRRYEVGRVVAAANMFDILPAATFPAAVQLPSEVAEAREASRKIWKPLPKSAERDSVLNALGRVGKMNLKQKLRHRAKFIVDHTGNRFPDLYEVTDEAVNCRNYYVHGGEGAFDYENNFDEVIFLVKTMDFVFAASDLIEAGWDVGSWCRKSTVMTHPFNEYRMDYREQVKALKAAIEKASLLRKAQQI